MENKGNGLIGEMNSELLTNMQPEEGLAEADIVTLDLESYFRRELPER